MRHQFFNYYVGRSHYFDQYTKLEQTYTKNNVFNFEQCERQIDLNRKECHLDLLVPMLLLVARKYDECNNSKLATIYFIECFEVLKQLNRNDDVLMYLLLELARLQKVVYEYEEATFYYLRLLESMIAKDDLTFFNKCANELTFLTISTRSFERIRSFYNQLKRVKIQVDEDIKRLIEIELLYFNDQYDELKQSLVLNKQSDLKLSEQIQAILKQRAFCVAVKENNTENCVLLTASEVALLQVCSTPYYATEYEVLKANSDKERDLIKANYIKNNRVDLGQLYDDIMLERQGIDNEVIVSYPVKEKVAERLKLKIKLQSIHANYKKYYSKQAKVEINSECLFLSKQAFIKKYEEPSLTKHTLLVINFHHQSLEGALADKLKMTMDKLAVITGEIIYISQFDNLLWGFFDVSDKSIAIKNKINRLFHDLYDEMNQTFEVAVCLPQFCTNNFNEDHLKIYDLMLAQESYEEVIERYEVSYYHPKIITLSSCLEASNIVSTLIDEGYFNIVEESIYEVDQFYGFRYSLNLYEEQLRTQVSNSWNKRLERLIVRESELKLCELLVLYKLDHLNSKKAFISLSRETLMHRFISKRLLSIFSSYRMRKNVVFEIEEDVLFDGNKTINANINQLITNHFCVALSEYGTGDQTGSIKNLSINYLLFSLSLIERIKGDKNLMVRLNKLKYVCKENKVKLGYFQVNSEQENKFVNEFGVMVKAGVHYH